MPLASVSPHYVRKWSHDGIICTSGSRKNVVKPTFAKGASMKEKQLRFHAAATSRVQRNSVPSTHMRCMITANRRANATMAFFIPRCLAIFIAQALSQDHFVERTSTICALGPEFRLLQPRSPIRSNAGAGSMKRE